MPSAPGETFALTEEPDLIVWRMIGHVSGDDIRRLFDVQQRFCEGWPHAFVLVDVRRAEHFTPEARRIAAEGPAGGAVVLPIRANAVVGASFHIRVLGTLVSRAAALLNPTNTAPLRFFETEPEARAWLAERSREINARR
ncbi:STAS/SEC14 domain-containing protein [Polyangium sorediatum]|uniref:STAS/SEC14 domain-containing protein n=1 Tax=Polyangium sorediatum TaxID=889274 RepID=A0ABT6NQ30_9BACT|nr:STAS/SEC14 domain-containing protein [Polyangium sorediatum]MDI1430432.1 STAS/SEC14 domain-containing protein [Polyangium sorediatum]